MTDAASGHADEQWQLEGDAAELYQRHLVPAVTAGWAADLIERAGLRSWPAAKTSGRAGRY